MYPSEWAGQKVEVQAHGHRLVWVEDPYQLILPEEIDKLKYRLSLASREVVAAGDAFTLRRLLNDRDPSTARMVVIDQSYTPREPHLLPQDTEPKDLVPIKAPDWKPLVDFEARLRPTIRDFLIYVTDDDSWPAKVNIFPYEELARTDPEGFVRAFESFRQAGRSLTSEGLLLVGASAALGMDLLDLTDPILALQLAFHSDDKWANLTHYFNRSEIEQIRARLQKQSGPVGELFGDRPDRARLALVSLIVLSQHAETPGLEQPGRQLPLLDASLAPYIDCTATAVVDPPSWFVEEEVPRFEKVVQRQRPGEAQVSASVLLAIPLRIASRSTWLRSSVGVLNSSPGHDTNIVRARTSRSRTLIFARSSCAVSLRCVIGFNNSGSTRARRASFSASTLSFLRLLRPSVDI